MTITEISVHEIAIRLSLSLLMGGIIGYNRGIKNHIAGIKTHMLVSLGASLSIIIPLASYNPEFMNYDPFRLSAQVISGIGFLGAGTIIQHGKIIKGLTTAASLWTVAIIAIAIGSGSYFAAIFSFGLVIFSLTIINKINFLSTDKTLEKTLIVKYVYSQNNKDQLYEFLKKEGISPKYENILRQVKSDNDILCYSTIEVRYMAKHVDLNEIIVMLMEFEFMKKVEYTIDIKV